MIPKQQECVYAKTSEQGNTRLGEAVVISGIAGLYPDSHDVKQLSKILYEKINPIKKSSRWKHTHPEAAQFCGNIPDLKYFDAQFFKVHYRLCNLMDPMSRKLMEQTYQAIYDAGVSPGHLSGKKVGVFIGTCFSETEKACFYLTTSRSGVGIVGCNKSMFANRISYWLNAKGPSLSVDNACCSSITALELAYSAMTRGDCEAAIVGGANLCLHPQSSIHYGRIMKLSKDGKTKSFDKNATGCTKTEAVNVLFLQKARDALRVYAEVVHAKSEFTSLVESETGAEYGFCRNSKTYINFLDNFYKEANILPKEVQYVEAFGSATPEADKLELEVIDEIFCKVKNKPMLVGSVMSNIGYGEAASGISAVTKVLLGYYHGKLAANLNYKSIRNDIPAIKEGRIEILKEHKEFDRTYAAVDSMSITGINSHVLLHGQYKPKDINRYKANIPRIVLLSGRQESSVQKIIDDLKSRPMDPEEHALLHNIHETKISGHLARGFVILDTNEKNETKSLCEDIDHFDQGDRPLWFVYSGMGSQWVGMGKELMRIPIFASAIERCHRVLEPKGVNIIDIITSDDVKMFDNILHSFVGITAIQIGLTDILHKLHIFPDNMIGHSLGEIGCAYADGCFTLEETILCSYSRGLVSIQTPLIRGSMAAVGLGYKQISNICPPGIEVACHNSPDSSTISGPADVMKEFVDSLTSKGIFAKEVPCSNIAYHSRYIADAGPALLKYMSQLVTSPKLRSKRWLSTSVPQDKWHEPSAKYCSAQYHTNNLLNPVLFEETSRLIPSDAIIIEIAPHGLLQAILKRSLPTSCCLLPLTRRQHPHVVQYLLEAIGRLYVEGLNPKVSALYPKVKFPVSTETPMLSHLVEWAHSEKWTLLRTVAAQRRTAASFKCAISTFDPEHNYLRGHVIRGKNLYPFAAALVSVWDTLLMTLNIKPKRGSVRFQDVYLHSQPLLHEQRQLRVTVSLHRGTGQFEVLNENSLMVRGFIKHELVSREEYQSIENTETNISAEDVYQLLRAKDFHYMDDFRSIHSINDCLTEAQIEWKDNWVTFIDGILQLNILRRKHSTVSKPNFIRELVIDINKQLSSEVVHRNDGVSLLNAHLFAYGSTMCGGIVIKDIKFTDIPIINEDVVELKILKPRLFFSNEITNESNALYIFLQIVAEKLKKQEFNIMEIVNKDIDESEFNNIENIINSVPGIKAEYTKININQKYLDSLLSIDLLFVSNLSSDKKMYQTLSRILENDSFFINKQTSGIPCFDYSSSYHVVSSYNTGSSKIELATWKSEKSRPTNILTLHAPKEPSDISLSTEKLSGEYYLPLEDETDPNFGGTLKIAHIGDLNSLYWVKASQNNILGVNVQVHYAGVNMLHVNNLLGTNLVHNVNDKNKSIIDFSGITKSGTRVMGIVQNDAITSRINVNSQFLWSVPASWSLEEAASVPLAYSLAFYILFIKIHLQKHYTICVHGGAGALGQAIINIALAYDCEIFTTVSSNSKKQFLLKLFPQLKSDHIANSRDLSFVDTILSATKGNGCHIVISCVKEKVKNFALQCSGSYGITIDTSLIQNREVYNFGLNNLSIERGYMSVDFLSLFQTINEEESRLLLTLMTEGISRGYVRPLTHVTFQPQDAARAFRLQAACLNRGRVLLDLRYLAASIQPRVTCTSSSWQLIASDNEILTLKLAERLIKVGAKKLVLLLDNPSKCIDVQSCLWNEDGVEIKLISNQIWKESQISDAIQHCKNESSLESVIIILTNKKSNVNETVKKINTIVQQSGISLKYFALISTGDVKNEQSLMCGVSEHQQIITNIKLPDVQVMNSEQTINKQNMITINNSMDILERALCYEKSIILAHRCPTQTKTLLEQVLQLAGLKELTVDNATLELTLKELNIDNCKLLTIQGYLRDKYEISLKVEDVQKLSIKSLYHIEKECKGCNFVESTGLDSYFVGVDTDELLSTTEMIFLPTLCCPSLRDDEIDISQTHLCIIPGVEGHHSRFKILCERLKLPALVLQPGVDCPNETVLQLANRFAQILLKKAALHKKFYLLGYESGVLVALEIASILEESGLIGTVFCIGGSPKEIIAHFQENLRDYKTSQHLQNAVLKHMYTLMTNEDPDILELWNNSSWLEKINACMGSLVGKVPHSIQYARRWIEMAYTRLESLLKFNPEPKMLRSQLVSLRPRYPFKSIDLSLQYYSQQKIISYQLQAPLSSATQDLMCTTIINQHLDDDILENFNDRNICETYLLNADSIADSLMAFNNDD